MSPTPTVAPWPDTDRENVAGLVLSADVLDVIPDGGPIVDRSAHPWHGHRPAVFAVMRDIDRMADVHDGRRRYLESGNGRPIGGAAFDEQVKAEAIWSFLRYLRRGQPPEVAYAEALEESRMMVRMWNRSPRCVVVNHPAEAGRYEDTCEPLLGDLMRRLAAFGEPVVPAVIPEPPRNRGVDGTIAAPGV